jgi:membrane protease YdiL (CAAX protease family)
MIVRTPIAAVAISLFAGIGWSRLFNLNREVLPDIPWAAVTMAGVIGSTWRYCTGWGWPRDTAAARREAFRRPWPPARAAAWTLGAVLSITVSAVAMTFVGFRLGHFDDGAFATPVNSVSLTPALLVSRVLMAACVAGFFEEAAFRGLMQSSWEERFGPGIAIGATSLWFYAMHLFHGWARGDLVTVLAIAIPFIATSALWGALAYLSGALGPTVVSHVAVDVIALSLEWNVLGSYNLTPVAVTGIDRHFVVWSIILLLSMPLALESLRRVALAIQPRAARRPV